MRKVVALVTLKREHSPRTSFWKSSIPALGLTAEGTAPEEADAKLLRMYWTLVNTYRRLGEDKLAQMLSRAGVEWEWEDEYVGRRRALDTASPSCGLRRRASPGSTRSTTYNALPLAA